MFDPLCMSDRLSCPVEPSVRATADLMSRAVLQDYFCSCRGVEWTR